MSLRTA
jgi:hypothetical protein